MKINKNFSFKMHPLTILLGLIIALCAFSLSVSRQDQYAREEFLAQANLGLAILKDEMQLNRRSLLGVVSFYDSSEFVSKDEFKTYTNSILDDFSYIKALAWLPLVTTKESAKDTGLTKTLAVTYVQPFMGNHKSIGFDYAQDDEVFAVLQYSSSAQEQVSISKNGIFEDENKEAFLQWFAPVYNKESNDLKGFVLGVYEIRELIEKVLIPTISKGLTVSVYDKLFDEKYLIYGKGAPSSILQTKRTLELPGQRLIISFEKSDYLHNFAFYSRGISTSILVLLFFIPFARAFERVKSKSLIISEEVNRWTRELKAEVVERKKAKAQVVHTLVDLERTTFLMKSIQDALNTSTLVSETDISGVITYVNDGFLKLSKYSREDLIGKNHSIIKSSHHSKDFFQDMWKQISLGQSWNGDIKNRAKDGSFYWVNSTIYPVKNKDGKVIKYTAIRFDISNRKLVEEELFKSKEKAEIGMKIKSEFMANMSHEIRTPMNGVLGMVSLLEDTNLDHEQLELLEVIKTCGDGLFTILNDILDFSKVEAGMLTLESRPFNLKNCVKEIMFLMKNRASQKGIKLTYFIDNSIPNYLLGDVTRVKQILVNLLSNAVKFTHEGHVKLSIISNQKEQNLYQLTFSIDDSGIGISKENQKNLFLPFSQVDTSTTREYGGTGLGLSICDKLSKLMNGQLWITGEEGEGTTFYFMADFSSLGVEQIAVQEVKPEYGHDLALKIPLRILLVENNLINQKLSVMLLLKLGYAIDVVGDGQQALDILKKKKFDLIFMDMQMPVMDGLEATKIIIERMGENRPRIVAMTANVLDEDREKCFAVGMDDFIGKPIQRSSLAKVLIECGELIELA